MIPPSLTALVKIHNFLGLTGHSSPQSAHVPLSSNTAFLSSMSLDSVWTLTGHL